MRLTDIIGVLLALTPVTYSRVIARADDKQDEAVFLTNCKRWVKGQTTFNGASDFMLLTNNIDAEPPKIIDQTIPHDPTGAIGLHIKYEAGTAAKPITGTFAGNRKFDVWDLSPNGDSKTNVTGFGTLDGVANPMRCYNTYKKMKMTRKSTETSWFECESRYFCTRKHRKIRRTDFQVRNSTVDVRIGVELDPTLPGAKHPIQLQGYVQETFGYLGRLYDEDVSSKRDTYSVRSGDAKIEMYYNMVQTASDRTFDEKRIPAIRDYLVKELAPKIAADAVYDKCEMSPLGQKLPICYWIMKFPQQIDIRVQEAEQQDLLWEPRDFVGLQVTSNKQPKDKCKTNGAVAKALSTVFSVAGELIPHKGYSAAAKGLGGIFGTTGAAACGQIPLWN